MAIGNRYKLSGDAPTGLPSIMPYPIVSERKEEGDDSYEQWFRNNAYFIIGFYDQPNNNISFPWDTNGGSGLGANVTTGVGTNNKSTDETAIPWWYQPSSQMLLNYTYYMQMQPNLDANHLTKNIDSTNLHAVWARGGRIASIVRKSCGFFQQRFEDIRFATDPLSPDAKDEKDKYIKREKILMILKPAWEKYMKELAEFPQQAKPFESPEEVEKWAATELKDFLADDYLNIAVDNYKRLDWRSDIQQIYLDARICDCTGIEHRVDQGHYTKTVHMPYNLIVDTRYDDPFGKRRRFAGCIEQLTLTEVFYKYPQLEDEDRDDLYQIAISRSKGTELNDVLTNLPWFNYNSNYVSGNYTDMTVSNVRVYWIAPENIDGNIVQTCYTAEILAGRYMLNYGKCENIIENPNNPYIPMLPLQILTPDMKLGMFNSAVSRDRSFQNDYDRIRFKQMEMLGKADGIVAFFRGERAGNDPKTRATNIKQYGFDYLGHSGQANNPADNARVVETWDRRLDPAYQQLSGKLQEISTEMEMNMGETAVTLGENTRYIGKDAYKDTNEAGASGTYSFDEKVMTFIQMNMDMGINIKKNLYASGYLEDEAQAVVGKDGLWRLKKTKERYTRDFGIYLELNDKMSSEQKKEMFQLLQPKMQNPNSGYTESDVINLYMAVTKTQLKDKVKIIEARIRKEKEAAMQAQAQETAKARQEAFEHEKAMAAFVEASKQKQNIDRIVPKQEKLDTERELTGLQPLHPQNETPAIPQAPSPGQPIPGQEQPNQPPVQPQA